MNIIEIIGYIRTGRGEAPVFASHEWWTMWRGKMEIVRDTFVAIRDQPTADRVTKFIQVYDKEYKK